MTFQMPPDVAEAFLRNAKRPIILVTRDPRLSVASRITRILEGQRNPDGRPITTSHIDTALAAEDYSTTGHLLDEDTFPLKDTGLDDLLETIARCQLQDIPYEIVDATAFRTDPERVLGGPLHKIRPTF